jgi:hypothetical protein
MKQASKRARVGQDFCGLLDEVELAVCSMADGIRDLFQRDIDDGTDYADAVAARLGREAWAARGFHGRTT